ncbi:MAG: glycosyltransferase [Archaeoglobaceae archaeon]
MDVSIVVPVFNEEESVGPLFREIEEVMSSQGYEWEVLFIDDGSTDRTLEEIKKLDSDNVRVVKFKRNFGQSAALQAGFDYAKGDVIISMDGDLQNDPHDIPRLLEQLDGYDCVCGWRKNRNDPFIGKKLPSKLSNKLAGMTGVKIHDFGCTFRAYKRESLNGLSIFGEQHRYIPAKLHKKGYRIKEVPVNHRAREVGSSKYGPTRLVKGMLDLVFHVFWNQFSMRPLHFLGVLGVIFMTAGFLIGFYWVIMKYFFGVSILSKLAQLLLAVGMLLFGFLMVMFGFLAEMLTKVYYEDKRPYVVDSVVEHPEGVESRKEDKLVSSH